MQPSKNAQNTVKVEIDSTDLKKTNLVSKKRDEANSSEKHCILLKKIKKKTI